MKQLSDKRQNDFSKEANFDGDLLRNKVSYILIKIEIAKIRSNENHLEIIKKSLATITNNSIYRIRFQRQRKNIEWEGILI